MANKKYVIMRQQSSDGGTVCPTVAADDNRAIKAYQKRGYKIIGRVNSDEGFIPDYVVTDVLKQGLAPAT